MSIKAEQRYYLKLKALYYLYEKRYTNTEIAKLLGVSRVTLNHLLDEAHKEGMVNIEIIDSRKLKSLIDIEEQLKARFDLQDVKIVDVSEEDSSNVNQKLALEGAKYFELFLRKGMKIGITWGRTLRAMVNNLSKDQSINNLEVYTLLGGAYNEPDFQPNILAQELIELYSGKAYIINAPFMCYSDHLCNEIKKEPSIDRILKDTRNLDITLVGIGEEPCFESVKTSYYHFNEEIVQSLLDAGAVGDICGNFFDINGNPCDSIISKRIVSIDILDLKSHKKVIGIGGGPTKIKSILGVLNGHYLDVLITDLKTANKIIKLLDEGR